MAGPIRISILADAKNAVGGLNDTGRAADGLGTKFRGAATAALKYAAAGAVLGAGAAVVGLAKLAKGAAEDQQAATLLASALKKSAGATDAQVKATESYISKVGVATGITDDELRPALTKLAQATGSVAKAQAATTLATDVAAGSNTKLEAVTKTLAKAYTTGSVTALSKYGIAAKNADGSTKTLAQATDELGKKFGGSAAAKADTLQGKIGRLKLIASEAGESIGYKLIPIITSLADFALNKAGPAISTIAAKVQEFVGRLGGGAGAAAPFLSVLSTLASTVTGTIVPAITSLATYVTASLMPVFTQVASIVQTQVIPILASLGQFFAGTLLPAIVGVYQQIASNLKPVFDQLVTTFQSSVLPTVQTLLAKFQEAQPTLQKVALAAVNVIGTVTNLATTILGKVLPVVIKFAGFLIANVVPALASIVVEGVKVIGKIIDFGQAVVDGAQKVADFATKVGNKIDDVVSFFTGLPAKIKAAIGDAGQMLLAIGGNIVDGLVNGIRNAAGKVAEAVQAIVDKIPDVVKQALGIASPSRVTMRLGRFVAQGLAEGILQGRSNVERAIGDLAGVVTGTSIDPLTVGVTAAAGAGVDQRDPFGERVDRTADFLARIEAHLSSIKYTTGQQVEVTRSTGYGQIEATQKLGGKVASGVRSRSRSGGRRGRD